MYLKEEPSALEAEDAEKIMDIAASQVGDTTGLVAAMSHDHRTRQQNFTRLAVRWIEYLADLEAGEYDGRNQASVRLAKQIRQTPNWELLKHLPYI